MGVGFGQSDHLRFDPKTICTFTFAAYVKPLQFRSNVHNDTFYIIEYVNWRINDSTLTVSRETSALANVVV